MQLGTIRTSTEGAPSTRAVRLEGEELILLEHEDVGALLHSGGLAESQTADGERISVSEADWAPLVTRPDKIVCVGLNYREHVTEMGRELPAAPTYFSKYCAALIGAHDDIALPPAAVSEAIDFEVELCIVIGSSARHVSVDDALNHVAGYTILNDISVRDWQTRTGQFLAGKTFEAMTPVGPLMTTTDELGDGSGLTVTTAIDGEVMQDSTTDELVFGVAHLVADLSTIITLEPGDLIATGTPSGVGAGRSPQRWLRDGEEVVTTIEGIGELRNRCVRAHGTA